MKTEIRKYVHNAIIGIAIVSVLYVFFIIIFDENSILSILYSVSLKTWALILLLSLINYFLRFLRWSKFIFFLNPKTEKLTFFQNLVIYLSGFAFTLTPGKAGETVRSFYLNSYKISYQSSIGAFIAERLQDIIVIFLISLLCVPLLVENTFELKDSANNSLFIFAILILFLISLFFLSKIQYKSKLKKFMYQKIKEIYSKIKFLFSFEIFSFTFFFGFIAWIAEAFALYLIIEDIFPGHDLILISMGIYGLAVLAGSLTFLPGGIGGTEAVMIILLSLLGIDYISALAITIICRAATLWFAIFIGGISFFFIKEY